MPSHGMCFHPVCGVSGETDKTETCIVYVLDAYMHRCLPQLATDCTKWFFFKGWGHLETVCDVQCGAV